MIFSLDGRKVHTIQTSSNEEISIPISNLQKGMYLLQILDKQSGSIIEMQSIFKQ